MNDLTLNSLKIRWMVKSDLLKVVHIESRCFQYAWNTLDFETCIKRKNCIGLVATIDNTIIGYVIYELFSDSYEILNFAIDPEYHRRKYGTILLNKILKKLGETGRNKVLIRIVEYNTVGQLFLRKNGFKWVKTLKNFYDEVDYDAYNMEYKL